MGEAWSSVCRRSIGGGGLDIWRWRLPPGCHPSKLCLGLKRQVPAHIIYYCVNLHRGCSTVQKWCPACRREPAHWPCWRCSPPAPSRRAMWSLGRRPAAVEAAASRRGAVPPRPSAVQAPLPANTVACCCYRSSQQPDERPHWALALGAHAAAAARSLTSANAPPNIPCRTPTHPHRARWQGPCWMPPHLPRPRRSPAAARRPPRRRP